MVNFQTHAGKNCQHRLLTLIYYLASVCLKQTNRKQNINLSLKTPQCLTSLYYLEERLIVLGLRGMLAH